MSGISEQRQYLLAQLVASENKTKLRSVVIKICEEQLEEEGGNEELEAQQINIGYSGVIKAFANKYKRLALNYFVDFRNPRP
ncbi:MAG: hypothetical protein EZS28_008380 [Streblomastix strix]|uniref:Uncharacterized protein n=1 Tax=Streblomastix strix TaxID=222440 RepID=A0A5J4WNA2_9EUKA|nr:MAG: hypothetical protein EZS28_008380 [Streblomastix strix]